MADDALIESAAAVEEPVAEAKADIAEKMIPASRVEELIKKAKLKGRDAMQDELEAVRRENEELKQKASGGSMGGMALPVDTESIRKQVYNDLVSQLQSQQEAQVQADLQKEAERLASDYHQKMKGGKENFPDFEEVMADFNPAAFPQLVYLATTTDNTAAVMYELQKNPQKLATLAVLSERDPKAAQSMINKLSASIKSNEQAKASEQNINAPLNRMQPSPTGQDKGGLEIADFKRMFKG